MYYDVSDVAAYMEKIPEDRVEAMERLRQIILDHVKGDLQEEISAGMINYFVPLSRYPAGYHVTPGEPLPFIALASQKHHIAFYHMGLYGDAEVEAWFREAYAQEVPTKLDMGKSCIRFKNPKHIPFDLMARLCEKISVDRYISRYEADRK